MLSKDEEYISGLASCMAKGEKGVKFVGLYLQTANTKNISCLNMVVSHHNTLQHYSQHNNNLSSILSFRMMDSFKILVHT